MEGFTETLFIVIITARVRSTREGNVLTRVCPSINLSVHRGGYPYPIMLCNISQNAMRQRGGTWTPPGGGTRVRYPPRGGTRVRYPPGGGTQVRYPPRGGYPGRTTEGVLTTRRAVCLLRLRRRTFLFVPDFVYFQGLTSPLPTGIVAPTPIISRVILPPPQTQATNLSLKSQPTTAVASSHENGVKRNNAINSSNNNGAHTGPAIVSSGINSSSGGGGGGGGSGVMRPPSSAPHHPPPLTPPAAHTKNQINHNNNNKIPLQIHNPTSPSPSPLIKVPHYTAHRPSILQVTNYSKKLFFTTSLWPPKWGDWPLHRFINPKDDERL